MSDRRRQDNLDPSVRSEIGRKGGQAVSRDRQHMAEIGRKGGMASGGRQRPGTDKSDSSSIPQPENLT